GIAGSATTISPGTGLTGGGELSANRTLSIDIASPAQAQAGTNNTTVITPLRMAQGTIGSSVQSWSNEFSNRSPNTIYQNTTGRPINVIVRASGLSSGNHVIFRTSPNGSTGWIQIGLFVFDSSQSQSAIIPNGWYYQINGNVNLGAWSELR